MELDAAFPGIPPARACRLMRRLATKIVARPPAEPLPAIVAHAATPRQIGHMAQSFPPSRATSVSRKNVQPSV